LLTYLRQFTAIFKEAKLLTSIFGLRQGPSNISSDIPMPTIIPYCKQMI